MVSDRSNVTKAIIVSGLPASGKTTIGKIIASELNFSFFDKDEYLERLFDDYQTELAPSRLEQSRKSDSMFEENAKKESSVVLVSHWHPVGKNTNSGTPAEWVLDSFDAVIEVTCICDVRVASERFNSRNRHLGHQDRNKSLDEISAWLVGISDWYPLNFGSCISVKTEENTDIRKLKKQIDASF